MTKAPPQNVGGQSQQMMVPMQVYMVQVPFNGEGQQQAQWSTPDQQQTNGNFGNQHMSGNAMQQTGPGQWNTWQEMPNQQFSNQPQHQTALQDYQGWAPGPQHQQMQDHSQQGWAQPGTGQQQQHSQQQQQQMMAGGTQQQPMMGNNQQQMMGNQQMVQMMPQDNQYYFGGQMQGGQMQSGQMQGVQQVNATPQQMPMANNTTPQSNASAQPAAAALTTATPAVAKPKKKGLMNRKIDKDGVADQVQPEAEAPKKEPEPQQQTAVAEPAPTVPAAPTASAQPTSNKVAFLEEVAAKTAISGGDSRSMIKALNLQPISAPSAKGKAPLRGKQGPMTKAEEIQALKDFAASQKPKDRVEEPPAQQEPPQRTQEATPPVQQQPLALPAQQQVPVMQNQAMTAPQMGMPTQALVAQPTLMMPAMGQPNQVAYQFQPMPTPQPQQQAAPAPKTTKGVRLNNLKMSKTGVAQIPEKDTSADASTTPKPEEVRTIKTPVVEENLSLTDTAHQEPRIDPREQERRMQLKNSVLLGRTNGFDRNMMLRFWSAAKVCVPVKDLGYRLSTRDESSPSPGETWRIPRKGVVDSSPASWRTGGGKTGKGAKVKDKEVLKPGVNAYKIQKAQTREKELQRDTRALLNKICPENKEKIIERLAATQLDSVDEMETIINIIFQKVTDDPHYCTTYVEMIQALNKAYPEFPPEEEGQSPATFRRMLVNMCQDKFEEMLQKLEADDDATLAEMEPDELLELTIKKKKNAMATMKFIGNLFVKQLLAAAVIRRVLGDLLDGEPPEMQVEYALELVSAVGKQFDSSEKDKAQISIVLDRLMALKSMKSSTTEKPLLSRRLQFAIEDMWELRKAGWVKKGAGVKEEAKRLDQVAKEQDREEREQASQAARQHGKGYGRGGGGRH